MKSELKVFLTLATLIGCFLFIMRTGVPQLETKSHVEIVSWKTYEVISEESEVTVLATGDAPFAIYYGDDNLLSKKIVDGYYVAEGSIPPGRWFIQMEPYSTVGVSFDDKDSETIIKSRFKTEPAVWNMLASIVVGAIVFAFVWKSPKRK